MRIAIINQPLGNRGDESAHKAFIHSLMKSLPGCKFDVIFLNREQTLVDAMKVDGVCYINIKGSERLLYRAILYSYILRCIPLSFFHPMLRRYKRIIEQYEIVICAPGGICMGGFMNWKHIWQLSAAQYLKKPTLYWGRSIGPFSDNDIPHHVFKRVSYQLLRNFDYLSLRDNVSTNIAKEIGVAYDSVVDSAFLETPDAAIPDSIKRQLGLSYIVFVPNSLTWHYKYKGIPQDRIDSFHLEIIDIIHTMYPASSIVMLPQTFKSKIDDYNYFLSIKNKSSVGNIVVIDENQNSDIQQKIISGARLVIGERYHSVVFAINNSVPFISLVYEHKMSGLLETLGMTEYSVDIQNIFDNDAYNKMSIAIEKIKYLVENIPRSPSPVLAKTCVRGGLDNMISLIKSMEVNLLH